MLSALLFVLFQNMLQYFSAILNLFIDIQKAFLFLALDVKYPNTTYIFLYSREQDKTVAHPRSIFPEIVRSKPFIKTLNIQETHYFPSFYVRTYRIGFHGRYHLVMRD